MEPVTARDARQADIAASESRLKAELADLYRRMGQMERGFEFLVRAVEALMKREVPVVTSLNIHEVHDASQG